MHQAGQSDCEGLYEGFCLQECQDVGYFSGDRILIENKKFFYQSENIVKCDNHLK